MRRLGHDAIGVREASPGADDEAVLSLALREARILITEDKDFGALVRRRKLPHAGVILLRLRRSLPEDIHREIEALLESAAGRLQNRFVVVKEGRVRIR